jgi:uncharacterized membrane protein
MTDLPRDGSGFRLRGLAMTRIETFTDAAFAFALTLLVVSLEPPTDMAGLRAALHGVPAFLLSAAMLMMFWWGHHEWSRRYGLDDGKTIVLSCVLVCTVLVYVYPLRFMFGLMITFIGQLTGIGTGTQLRIDGPADVNTIFAIYGVGFTAMALSIMLLNLHAWRLRDELELDAVERHETRAVIGAWCILCAAGVLSVAVALLTPPHLAGLPGWAYAPLAFVMPLYGRWMTRRRPPQPPLTAHAMSPILPRGGATT